MLNSGPYIKGESRGPFSLNRWRRRRRLGTASASSDLGARYSAGCAGTSPKRWSAQALSREWGVCG